MPQKESPAALAGAHRADIGYDQRSDTAPPLPPQAPGPRIVVRRWRPMHRATLCRFADVEPPSGLQIDDIAVHLRNGRTWASLPGRPIVEDGQHVIRDGKPAYARILGWRNRNLADRFSAAVVELVRAKHPGALDWISAP